MHQPLIFILTHLLILQVVKLPMTAIKQLHVVYTPRLWSSVLTPLTTLSTSTLSCTCIPLPRHQPT